MKFIDYLKKYNKLLDNKEKLQQSLKNIEDQNIINIVTKEINSIDCKIYELKNKKLYDEEYIENERLWN